MESETRAAPPDAGGHQGSQTRPDGLLQQSPEPVKKAPALSDDGRRDPPAPRPVAGFIAFAVVVLAICAFFLFAYGPG